MARPFISGVRGAVWKAILASPSTVSNGELASHVGCAKSQVTRAIGELEDHGYLIRYTRGWQRHIDPRPDFRDGRA